MIQCIYLLENKIETYISTMTLNSNEKYIVYNILQSKYDDLFDLLATYFSFKFFIRGLL